MTFYRGSTLPVVSPSISAVEVVPAEEINPEYMGLSGKFMNYAGIEEGQLLWLKVFSPKTFEGKKIETFSFYAASRHELPESNVALVDSDFFEIFGFKYYEKVILNNTPKTIKAFDCLGLSPEDILKILRVKANTCDDGVSQT